MAGFWKTYPLSLIFESKLNTNIFLSQEFERSHPELSPEYSYKIISGDSKSIDTKQITGIRQFIKTNFGCPPKTPILDIPEKYLLSPMDYIIIINHISSNNIVGCIRYHYLGEFTTSNSEQIYCVDCFCIHPGFRKKGLGDFLLTKLHCIVNSNQIPFSLFLKEGPQLSIIHTPLYSSTYVYRKLTPTLKPSKNIHSLSPQTAVKLIDIFQEFTSELFVIRNTDSHNQQWLLYKDGLKAILACFQDTFQWFLDDDSKQNKIVWCTGWFESPNITDNCREDASKQLSDYFSPTFQYVWMNKAWCSGNSSIWKDDGPFHWYTYQWCSALKIIKSYCIMT
jgi:hypothetical protein